MNINYSSLKSLTDGVWLGISDIWLTTQIIFQGVYRWDKYKETGIRPQDDLQHSYSGAILAKIFMLKIDSYNLNLNKDLVMTAFLIHDHGEGELKRDVCWDFKEASDDVKEYYAFTKRYSQLGEEIFAALERAYLLQYALKERPDFPQRAQVILSDLAKNNYYEALTFSAIEIWDYLLYALEQNQVKPNPIILFEVTRNQLPRMNALAEKLPGLKQEIWTEEIVVAFQKILE